jgi:arylsulfatase A-like enzyme
MLRFQTTTTPTAFFHAKDHTGPLLHTGTEQVVPDHLTAERVERLIRGSHAEPWGAYVNFQMTHFPYQLPNGVIGPYSPANPDPKRFRYLGYPRSDLRRARNKYDNALYYVDQQVGRLYRALSETGQLDTTILVITSDHGEQFLEHDMVTHGRSLYEVEARVPLLVHWPKLIEPTVSDAPVSHLDVLPTLADLLQVAPHPSFQGESFAAPDLINPKEKAIFLNIQGMLSAEAIVCWPYKLIRSRRRRTPELYNLAKDPDEQDDLYHPGSALVKRLRKLLRAQMRAQLRYHHPNNKELRDERFAPRLLTCDAPLDQEAAN